MAKIVKPRISAYVRNVGRSLGYAVGDAAGEYAPVLKSIVSDTKDAIAEAKTSSGDIKSSIRDMIKDFNSGPNVLTNTLDDLKTGNWYNKQREEQALNDMFGGFDFDDEDWGDFDFDDDSDTDDTSDDARDTKAIINSMDDLGMNISNSVAASTARSAEYIVAHQKASTRAMYELTGKGFNQVSNILLNMSDTMVGLASLGEPLTQHINNSSVFYTKTTEQLGKISESLETLVKRTAYMDSMNKGNNGKGSKGLDRFVSGGEFSLASYIDMVKENTKEQVEMVKGLAEVFGMAVGKGGKNMSLTTLMTQGIVKKLLPDFFKASAKQLSESINNAIIAGLMRGSKWAEKSSNPIINFLGSIFLPATKMKKDIDTSKYNRGPMQWDGESKKALTDVIPTYLAKIYASLSGDERYFNYETGKFTSIGQINKEREDYIKSQARMAGGDFRREALKKAKGDKNVEKAIENLFVGAIMNDDFDFSELQSLYSTDKHMYYKVMQQLGVSKRETEAVTKIIVETMNEARDGRFGNANRNLVGKFESSAYSARAAISRRHREQEQNGGNWGNLFDEFKTGGYVVIGMGGNGKPEKIGGTSIKNYKYKASNREKHYEKIKTSSGEEKFKVKNKYLMSKKEFEEYSRLKPDEQDEYLKTNEGRLIKAFAEESGKSITNSIFNIGKGKKDEKPTEGKMSARESLKYLAQRPFYAVSMAMDKLTQGINDLFWGPNGDDGIINRLKTKIEDTWKSLKDHLANMFKDENGGELTLKQAMAKEWGLLKGKARTAIFGDKAEEKMGIYDKAKEARNKFNEQYLNQFSSGELEKYGESATGSGLIHKIPSHRLSSAFKRGKHFKSTMFSGGESQLKLIEDNIYYNEQDGKYYEKKVHKAGSKIGQEYYKELKFDSRLKALNARNVAKVSRAHAHNVTRAASERLDALGESKPVQAVSEGAKTLGHGIMEFFNQVAYGDQDVEEQKKTMMDKLSKTMQDLSPAKGAMGIGAIGGVGVSLLTGALVGPIAGAAIGAGVGLATKSQAFQDFLFGTGDPEDPKYKKGLLGGFGQALKADGFKSLKGTSAGAGIGAAAGTLMGSPIVGAIIGGAAGYVASSQKAQKFLFGDGDEKTVLGKIKDKIKEHAPNMTAGMIAGLIAGPFGGGVGIAANLILGAGLGYISTSEKFKEFMFGKEEDILDKNGEKTGKTRRVGGLAGKIHDRIINPLDEIMHNLGLNIKNRSAKLFKSIDKTIKNAFKSAFGKGKDLLGALLGNTKIGKFAKAAGNKIKGIAELPGMALSLIDTGIQKSNLNIGAGVYDKKLGRNQTAEERVATRNRMVTGSVTAEKNPITGEFEYFKLDEITGRKKKIGRNEYLRRKAMAEHAEETGIGYGMGRLSNGYAALDEMLAGMETKDLKNIDPTDKMGVLQAIYDSAHKDWDKKSKEEQENIITKLNKIEHDVDFETSFKGLLEDELKGRADEEEKHKEEKEKAIREGQIEFFKRDNVERLAGQGEQTIFGKLANIAGIITAIAKDKGIEIAEGAKEVGKAVGQEIKENSRWGENGKPNDSNDTTIDDMEHSSRKVGEFFVDNGTEITRQEYYQNKEDGGHSGIRNFLRRFSGGASSKEPTESSTDMFGNVHQYKVNAQGEKIEDLSDKETARSRKVIDGFTKSIESLPLIGSAISGIKGINGFFDKMFDTFENIGEILSETKGGLFDFLTGKAESLLSTIKTFIGGTGAILAGTSLAAILSGKLDQLISNLVPGRGGQHKDIQSYSDGHSELYTTDSEGNTHEVATDKNGNAAVYYDEETGEAYYMDLEGNRLSVEDVQKNGFNSKATFTASQIGRARHVGNVIKGGDTIVGTVTKGLGTRWAKKKGLRGKIGQKILNTVNKASAGKRNFIRNAQEAIGFKIGKSKLGQKFISNLSSSGGIAGKFGNFLSNRVGNYETRQLASSALEKMAESGVGSVDEIASAMGKGLYKSSQELLKDFPDLAADEAESLIKQFGSKSIKEGAEEVASRSVSETIRDSATKLTAKLKQFGSKGASEAAESAAKKATTSAVAEGAEEATEKALKTAAEKANKADFIDDVVSGMKKLFGKIKTLFGGKIPTEVLDNMDDIAVAVGKETAEEAADKGARKGLGAALKSVPVVGWILAIADAAWSFEEGWNRAARELQVNEATNQEKALNGFVEAVIALLGVIPGAGILVSLGAAVLKPLIMKIVIKAMQDRGLLRDLKKRQEESKKQYEADEAANRAKYGANYKERSYDEWNAETNNNYTWGERAWNGIRSGWNNLKSKFVRDKTVETGLSGSRSGLIGLSGGASGFVSQFDPRFQSYQISGTNFAGKGCGPAVASMTAAALGKSLPVGSAVNASQGYQTANGVSLDYFANALGSRGIDTEYIAGGGAGDLYRSIASGKKVVLLGQDASNTSKAYSPFGPNNHYVVATGLDHSGNVVVNDPEMNRPTVYNPGILSSVKYGVAAGRSGLRRMKLPKLFRRLAGGGNPRNDETTQTIWAYLTQKLGMSEAAAAGIMGNMEAESGCQPDRHQIKGTAYGLCQWDGDRKTKLMQLPNYQTLGVQLNYLASELPYQYWKYSGSVEDWKTHRKFSYPSMTLDEFKSLTDVAAATIKFEAAFERAGKPNIEDRINWAKAYYEMFSGKTYDIDLSNMSTVGLTQESTSTTEEKYSFKNIFGIAGTIGSIFSDVLSGIFGKDDSTSGNVNGETTDGESYNVSTNPSGSKIVDLMRSKLGKLTYDMNGPRNPDQGSADCSSTVQWAVRKASGVDIGGSTPAQYQNSNLSTVWYGNGAYANEIPTNAKPGDILFFSRPDKAYSAGRKDRVGHVEIYEGNGMMIGHGSGMGPKEKAVPVGPTGKLIKVSRVNTGTNSNTTSTMLAKGGMTMQAAGSGLLSYSDLARAAGGSSGILMNSRAGSRNGKPSVLDPRTGKLIPISKFAGGATTIAEASQNMLNSVKSNAANNSKGISPELIAQLLSSITAILNNIADNTAPVNKIYQALVAYMESGGASGTDSVKIKKKPEKLAANDSNMSSDVDQNIKSLVATLTELAKG